MAETPKATATATASSETDRDAERKRAFLRFAGAARAVCETLLAAKTKEIDLPGGARQSIRMRFEDGRSAIVTRRAQAARGRLEAMILYALSARGDGVPGVIAYDGKWLIQEDLGGRRLAQALQAAEDAGDEPAGQRLLEAGLASLAANQKAAADAKLERGISVIGHKPQWIGQLVDMVDRLGRLLDAPPPPHPEALGQLLAVKRPRVIKWDARPGNAIVRDDGRVAWIDWEHCGCRNALDDVAWFLADEYTPDWPAGEAAALERHLPDFLDEGEDAEEALRYLAAFMAVHSCARASLILTTKKDGPWRDPVAVLSGDKVGVARCFIERCLARGARWAALAPETEMLAPWLASLAARLPTDRANRQQD